MDNLQDTLEAILPDVPVYVVRFPDAKSASGPSILWRVAATDRLNTFDVPEIGSPVIEIECRSPTWRGAQQIAADACDRLLRAGRINRVLDQFDSPDDASQERGKYFSHVVRFELAA